jgi:hypothetical protein
MIFIVLSSLETVHDTVRYRYCIFSLLYFLLRIRLKHQNPLLSYAQDRKQSHYRPKGPRGFQEVKVPRFHDNGTV